MNRIRIFIIVLAFIAPQFALADWKVYYTGKAAGMFGSSGRGNFATRSQCEAYQATRPGFERNNSHCSGFNAPSSNPAAPGGAKGDGGAAAREQEKQKQLQLQKAQQERELEIARQKKFAEDKDQLLGSLKGVTGGNPNALTLKLDAPEKAVASAAWTPDQCRLAQRRVAAYREALQQTVDVVERFNRIIAKDQALRAEWEKAMTDASDRAKNRGQFLWLALPLGKLAQLNGVADDLIKKDGSALADLLAGTTDPAKREQIRIARQFVAREKEAISKLGKSYENINDAQSLGGNAMLMVDDPDESPTSPFKGDGMKLREAGEMLFGVIVERDKWKRLAANAPWAKYLAGGLSTAFAAEAAARAMFDSWYDAFDAGLAWEQLNNMNQNSDRYLLAVRKLAVEMRKRSDRLNNAEKEFAAECSRPQ